nr:phosphoribosylformylglycinamidine synthase subunit PurL [Protofrankia symbiont of Coriaria ruscifolia]
MDGVTGTPTAPTAPSVAPSGAVPQPYRELGLTDDEYARIVSTLGRTPSDAELAMYSVMWSEHCSYKSSKVHLRQFRDTPAGDRLLVGMGENAGVVAVGEGLAVTFKIESHNHPSFVEPYQGAATGVGGIVRDILTMGARPIAVLDPLRFGDADAPDTARVLPGVVAGIGGYGNCLGLPTIGGEVVFDPSYLGNPLVNALCVGVMPVGRVQTSAAVGVGNAVVLLGAKTGRDGIGGVSVLASATFDEGGGPARRPSVQVGDPFTEKILIESCLELFDRGFVVGIQDLGGAGLTCALTETTAAGLAAGGPGGMEVDLDLVPLREASMAPHEILASESQERMLAIVTPDVLPEVLALAERWGVLATRIGTVTDSGRLLIRWHGEVVVDVPPGSLADDGPVYDRPVRRPADLDTLRLDDPAALPRPSTGDELRATLLTMIASPNLCSKAWVTDQYDRYVQANTVLAQPEDAGVIRLSERTGLGIALATDGNGRYTRLDPFAGAQLALAEACRNVAASGAVPIAVTNCLNFGSPENPEVMWQFAEACRGLADACRRLGLPVTGGNVSFYNQTGSTPINPTPIVGVLGLFDDVARRVPIGFTDEGDSLLLLGETRAEFGGSEWAWVTHRHLGGLPPAVDLAAEKLLAEILVSGSRDGMLTSAHDISDGGLAQTLVESCLRGGHGARIVFPRGADLFTELFSESAGRAVVAVSRSEELRFTDMCAARGLPWRRIGVVDGDTLEVQDAFTVSLDELRTAHSSTLPALFAATTPTT